MRVGEEKRFERGVSEEEKKWRFRRERAFEVENIFFSPSLSFSFPFLSLLRFFKLTVRVKDVPSGLAQLLPLQVELAADGVLRRLHVGVDEVRVEHLRFDFFFFGGG